jgi:hypothetical protein
MDPYLEMHWRDVHHRLVTYASDQLQPRLPRDLRARVEERVYVESEAAEPQRSVYPDVRVVETRPRRGQESQTVGVVEVSESVVIHLENEPVTEGYVQIVDQAYRNGAYDDLDYRAEIRPPLVGPDAAWVDELLRSNGLR